MNDTDSNAGEFSNTLKRQLNTIIYTAGPVLVFFVGIALGLPDLYRSAGVIQIEQDVPINSRAIDTYAE